MRWDLSGTAMFALTFAGAVPKAQALVSFSIFNDLNHVVLSPGGNGDTLWTYPAVSISTVVNIEADIATEPDRKLTGPTVRSTYDLKLRRSLVGCFSDLSGHSQERSKVATNRSSPPPDRVDPRT